MHVYDEHDEREERLTHERNEAEADADALADALRHGKDKWVSLDEYAHVDPILPIISAALANHDALVAKR